MKRAARAIDFYTEYRKFAKKEASLSQDEKHSFLRDLLKKARVAAASDYTTPRELELINGIIASLEKEIERIAIDQAESDLSDADSYLASLPGFEEGRWDPVAGHDDLGPEDGTWLYSVATDEPTQPHINFLKNSASDWVYDQEHALLENPRDLAAAAFHFAANKTAGMDKRERYDLIQSFVHDVLKESAKRVGVDVPDEKIVTCESDGNPGYKYDSSRGKCYTYTSGDDEARRRAKQNAYIQGYAIEQSKASSQRV